MRVLVLAPHPDDETIGCGGSIAAHAAERDEVRVLFLTSGELGVPGRPAGEARGVREREAEEAALVLGIHRVQFLRFPDWGLADVTAEVAASVARALTDAEPDVVYLPHGLEAHPDHAAAVTVMTRALEQVRHRPGTIRCYEVWTPMSTWVDFRDVTAHMSVKMAALRAYRSQLAQFPYDRAVEGLARYRGALVARTDHAEAFGGFPESAPWPG